MCQYSFRLAMMRMIKLTYEVHGWLTGITNGVLTEILSGVAEGTEVLTDFSMSGATGPQGPQGPAGTTPTINAQSPLSYSGGTLSINLTSYATKQYVDDAIAALANLEEEEF